MKLHLGCGTRRAGLEGFIHVDIRPEVNPDVIADITNLDGQFDTEQLEQIYWSWHAVPRAGDTLVPDALKIEMIYWAHGLEHVPRPLVMPTLRKFYALLAPGGLLRLSMPDFRTMAELYVLRGFPLEKVIGPIIGRQDYPENTHYGLYDFSSLTRALAEAGFERVREYDPRQVWPPEFDDYSLAVMDGRLISLNVECNKPETTTRLKL